MGIRKTKEIAVDLLMDFAGGLLIAIGVYNFAAASEFPVAGISGIALIFYHFFDIPIGIMTVLLNIPIILICYKLLGRTFFLKTLKTMAIATFSMDILAPLLPVYEGDLMLSCICMGLISGLGYALIYMRDTSTGGADFIVMAVRKLRPHLSLGKIIIVMDCTIVLIGGLLMGGNIDRIIYGLIGSYLLSVVVDKVMYGLDAGKLTLVVTEHGYDVAERIDALTSRGATILRGEGSYSKQDKEVVMCACNNKQMHMVHKAVKEVDPSAFLVTMEANQVRGQGFKPH
ncbi:MAG: YitT family protein [Tyzzerella sp.]|nr:YitT family protein [Tyzzerella sp.]